MECCRHDTTDWPAALSHAPAPVAALPPSAVATPPPPSTPVVRRGNLVDRLIGSVDLVVVTAPVGYGKTTLVEQWARADGRPFAWLSLDPGDNDPTVLSRSLALAVLRLGTARAAGAGPMGRGGARVTALSPQRVSRVMAEHASPFVLAIEDVDTLSSRSALDVLEAVLEHLPAGSTAVLTGRTAPALRLGRLRVRTGVVELGMTDLAIGVDDVEHLCRAWGVELGATDLADLVEGTEGWPAGVARRLAAGAGPPQHQAVMGGEWLDGLGADAIAFLRRVSCLDRFSGPLCDAVLGQLGSAVVLDDLARRNLLVIPVQRGRHWYRLHRLFAAAMQDELARVEPGLAPVLQARASAWFEAQRDLDGAITYALRSGDRARAEALAAANVATTAARGDFSSAARWLGLFSTDELSTSGQLAVAAAALHATMGESAAAAHWLACAERVVGGERPSRDQGATPPVRLALVRAGLARLSAREMLEEATYAWRRLPYGAHHAASSLCVGAAALMLGDVERATAAFADGRAEAADLVPLVEAQCLAYLALVHIDAEAWREAAPLAREARNLLAEHHLQALAPSALVSAVSYLVEAHDGNSAGAAPDRLQARHNQARYVGLAPGANLEARVALAGADLLVGNRAGARTLINEAEQILPVVHDAVRLKQRVSDLRAALAQPAEGGSLGAASLTIAELRVLQCLPTHHRAAPARVPQHGEVPGHRHLPQAGHGFSRRRRRRCPRRRAAR